MTTPFALDKDQLRQAALDLRQALFDARAGFEARGFPGSVELVDEALKKLDPILDLCIAKELEEPFNFLTYMGKVMGDDLGFPEIRVPFDRLSSIARGGIPILEFSRTEYYRRMPRQLRRPPEYQPSAEESERIEADLRLRRGG